MARIRSVHPDLFLDEAFVSLSIAARIFLIGLWTECDDHGAFEWQPGRLRFKILPADGIPGDELLGELVRANIVKRVEIDGRSYGLVRNFCRFQRPKKPTFKVEIPAEHWNFVAMKADGSLPSHHHITGITQQVGEDGNNRSPTSGEKSALEKEEGEGRRGKRKPKTPIESLERVAPATTEAPPPSAPETLSPKVTASPEKGLAALGSPLPERWVPDEDMCAKVQSEFGMTEQDLQREVPAFHAYNASQGTYSKDWNATFYLFCKRFAEHKAKQAPPRIELQRVPGSAERFVPTEADWDAQVKRWIRNNSHWSRNFGPEPGMIGCKCPPEILERHGIDPATGLRHSEPKAAANG